MTIVPASPRTTSYTLASATAGPFNVGFLIFDATLAVYVNEALRTDYTVSATFTGGFSDAATITFAAALASGDLIRIDGDMPISRGAEYLNPDPSLTTKLNIEQGRQWAAMQQLARDVERANSQDFHDFKAPDGALNFRVEALETATAWWAVMGGTPPFGPTLYADGTAADISAQIALKGEGRLTVGNALGRLLEVISGVAGYIADRVIKISPGLTGTTYASIDAEAGLDLKAGGDTIVRLLDGAGAGTAHLEISPQGTDYISVSTPAGKSLILTGGAGSGNAGLQLQHITQMDYQYLRHDVVNGGTVNLNLFVGINFIFPSGGIAGLTVNFPAAPSDGNVIQITAWNAVTAVTWASLGGHAINGAPAGLTTSDHVRFVFITGFGWKRF